MAPVSMRTRGCSLPGQPPLQPRLSDPAFALQGDFSLALPCFDPLFILKLLQVGPRCSPFSPQLLLLPSKPSWAFLGWQSPSCHHQHFRVWGKRGPPSKMAKIWRIKPSTWRKELGGCGPGHLLLLGFYCCQHLGWRKGLPWAGLEGDVPFGALPVLVGNDLCRGRGSLAASGPRGSSPPIMWVLQSFPFPREILQEFSISAGEAAGRGKVELSWDICTLFLLLLLLFFLILRKEQTKRGINKIQLVGTKILGWNPRPGLWVSLWVRETLS